MQKTFIHSFNKYISKIGLGCVTFGREINRRESLEILDYAAACGITHLDTAPSYGNGASETILGEWLSGNQDLGKSMVVASKIRPPFHGDSIFSSVTGSLARLKIDAIDLLYLHQWHPSLGSLEVLETLTTLAKDGKIKMIGASNFTAVQLQQALEMQLENQLIPFGFLQNNNNYAVRDITPDLLAFCRKQGVNIVTYSPLGAGYLSGKYQDGIQEGTRFAVVPQHAAIYFGEPSAQRLHELLAISHRTGLPASHLALSWAFQQDGISSVLIGARSKKHIEQAMNSIDNAFNEFMQGL